MKKYLIALAAGAAVLGVSPAAAEGFRAEIHTGVDIVSADDAEETGIVYGIGLGYDMPVGEAMTVGIDLSADLASTKECVEGAVVTGDEACIRAKRDLAAALRLGYKLNEQSTIYALAGYTNARFEFDYETAAGVRTEESGNLDGFRLGAGYQHGFGGNAYGKVEYRYSNYEADVTRHQVLLGVGLKF